MVRCPPIISNIRMSYTYQTCNKYCLQNRHGKRKCYDVNHILPLAASITWCMETSKCIKFTSISCLIVMETNWTPILTSVSCCKGNKTVPHITSISCCKGNKTVPHITSISCCNGNKQTAPHITSIGCCKGNKTVPHITSISCCNGNKQTAAHITSITCCNGNNI